MNNSWMIQEPYKIPNLLLTTYSMYTGNVKSLKCVNIPSVYYLFI